MTTRLLALCLLFLGAFPGSAEPEDQLDGNPTLFSVMAALSAANGDLAQQANQQANHLLREQVAAHLAGRKLTVLSELKNFFASHRKATPQADLAQYVSFALSVDGAPSFKSRFKEVETPPDVVALEGFGVLMARFHEEAGMDSLWQKSQPFMDRAIAVYQEPVIRAVTEVNGYMRNVTSGYMGRRFQIYLDPLGPANQIHTRSYGDEYFVVASSGPEPQVQEIRHAYLHFMLDPLVTKFSEDVNKKRGLIDYAQMAPQLADQYKSDFLLLATECLIKAIEMRMPGAGRSSVPEALAAGFVITPAFAELLPAYEKSQAAMRLYFPELIAAVDLKREERRLENVTFAAASTQNAANVKAPAVAAVPLTEAEKTLEAADKAYTARQLEAAGSAYRQVLEQTDNRTVQSRAYYGLARIAALQKDPELAEKLFRKTLELAPDPQTQSWSEVYLGRLAEASNAPEQAAVHYRSALVVDGASEGARKAAELGLSKSSLNKSQQK